ncbi:MAG: DUF1080 domain-containing protein [Chitinophagaceae bacterium]|jgi:hypothetical protein|nr:DUF1080 domain-containing protein [Chitinophagaceae bacterium]
MMVRTILIIAAVSYFSSCNNESGKSTQSSDTTTSMSTAPLLTQEEINDGWVSLFDGQSTKGWHKYGGAPAGTAWKAEDGILHLDASQKDNWQIKDGGDIVSDEEFENFHFKIEWKIDTCGNSGVIFYVNEDTAKYKYPWMTGPEMQVLDNSCHPDAKINKHRAGDLYDLISAAPETVKPALEWNLAEIKSLNGTLEFYLNETKVVTTTMWDEGWKKMIAGSKFKDMKDFGTYKKGRIGLQDHGNNVWFRNIKIKKL